MKQERKNRYTCRKCQRTIKTIDVDSGVTPAFLDCEFGCGGIMDSHFYKAPAADVPEYEWYKPKSLDGLSRGESDHVRRGGLLLRKRATQSYVAAGAPTDPTVVRALTRHLLEAYEQFVNGFDGELSYSEGFMGAHNFHVWVVEHLVEETGEGVWRRAAEDTFSRRMQNPGEFDTKTGFG